MCKNDENRSYWVINLHNFIIIYTGFSFHLVDGAPTHYENLINLAFPSNMPSEEKLKAFNSTISLWLGLKLSMAAVGSIYFPSNRSLFWKCNHTCLCLHILYRHINKTKKHPHIYTSKVTLQTLHPAKQLRKVLNSAGEMEKCWDVHVGWYLPYLCHLSHSVQASTWTPCFCNTYK